MTLPEPTPWGRKDRGIVVAMMLLAVAMWLPRLRGPLDLRYDAGVYYILGTSLAEGHGYRLLNEPGSIQAIQYPPLLAGVAAVTQRVLGTDDPVIVGHWLRLGAVLLYACYAAAVYRLSRRFLRPWYAALVTVLTVIHSHTIFISDFFGADVPYALVTTLFFITGGVAAAALAVAAYGIRSAGIALLGAWVAEPLIRRQPRRALARGFAAAGVVTAWMAYTGTVKSGPTYTHPAYAYQRAGYQFYNVDYAENMAYVDPFRPELGRVTRTQALGRVITNLSGMPMTIGEGVSVHRGWWHGEVDKLNARLGGLRIPPRLSDGLIVLLALPVVAGLALLALRGELMLVLYIAASLLMIAITPWPVQFVRYVVPLTPFLTLGLIVALEASAQKAETVGGPRWRAVRAVLIGVVGLVAVQQVATVSRSISKYPSPAVIFDRAGTRLRRQARPGEIVATSTPHWAYLRTGLRSVMPPYEADPARAESLLEEVPVTYLIVDQLSFLDVGRRYTIPVIKTAPAHWQLIYAVNDSGPRIYRRVTGGLAASSK